MKFWNFRFHSESKLWTARNNSRDPHGPDTMLKCTLCVLIWRFLNVGFVFPHQLLTTKTANVAFWERWMWDSGCPSKHQAWSACVLGVVRSHSAPIFRVMLEISIFHIRIFYFYFFMKYNIIYLSRKYALSWWCPMANGSWRCELGLPQFWAQTEQQGRYSKFAIINTSNKITYWREFLPYLLLASRLK